MKRELLLIFILVFTFSCQKDDVVNETKNDTTNDSLEDTTNDLNNNASVFEDVQVTFHEVSIGEQNDYNNLLQATITISSEYQISTFGKIGADGYASGIDKIYTYDAVENIESVMLLDENNEPSFIYGVDLSSGSKSNGVTEFERIDANSFYMRLYDYDWTNRLGTILFETVISENSGSFISSPTYEISNDQSSKSISSTGKGKPFKAPIIRLHQELQKSDSRQLRSVDSIDDWINNLTDFRNNQIPEFLDTLKNVGLVASIGAGAAVLVGSAGAAPLFVGAAALTGTAAALKFFISDDFSSFIEEVKTDFSEVRADLNSQVSGIVETLEGYGETASSFLNENINGFSVSEILTSLDQNELFVDTADLDDLPDSNGVLQIGLSWNNSGTDIDLYVTDPFGTTIYYENPSSSSGGFLDRDDVDGFGPENIFWNGNYPDGTYFVTVNYYGCDFDICPSTNYIVKISDGLGAQSIYSGSLNSEGATVNVTSFQVINGQISTSM